ncbi:hypothetical protein BU23DRAFT_643372 [Bimuria novae-zelandiae CBS 107.79]|uniref:Uncharacterized protein n=1 Tax=Bimuria novae-zelandiae CBS 107.79 TaxID=1447943 RepID=A0A6A5V6D3_9PLEO|nr:hypothetical protein BU23DRAFT_643372 [Bimuria novae-zelandiae CBS 107.79]
MSAYLYHGGSYTWTIHHKMTLLKSGMTLVRLRRFQAGRVLLASFSHQALNTTFDRLPDPNVAELVALSIAISCTSIMNSENWSRVSRRLIWKKRTMLLGVMASFIDFPIWRHTEHPLLPDSMASAKIVFTHAIGQKGCLLVVECGSSKQLAHRFSMVRNLHKDAVWEIFDRAWPSSDAFFCFYAGFREECNTNLSRILGCSGRVVVGLRSRQYHSIGPTVGGYGGPT